MNIFNIDHVLFFSKNFLDTDIKFMRINIGRIGNGFREGLASLYKHITKLMNV